VSYGKLIGGTNIGYFISWCEGLHRDVESGLVSYMYYVMLGHLYIV
jgi:hypothetical protein